MTYLFVEIKVQLQLHVDFTTNLLESLGFLVLIFCCFMGIYTTLETRLLSLFLEEHTPGRSECSKECTHVLRPHWVNVLGVIREDHECHSKHCRSKRKIPKLNLGLPSFSHPSHSQVGFSIPFIPCIGEDLIVQR